MANNILSLRPQYPGEGWSITTPFDINSIEDIDDGVGGDTNTQPTSIPSPFARIDLVRTALRNLNRGKNDPNSQRLVSKMLDLGELLFNYDNVSDKIRIDKWDIKNGDNVYVSTKRLKESVNLGHKRLGKVLEMFLQQDARSYNFDSLKHIHVISFDGFVIGGTSPVTMFFSTPNEHYFDKLDIRFGTHKLFDKDRYYVPLHERDIEYQKMWYYLYETEPGFKNYFKELAEYIETSVRYLRENKRSEIYDKIFNNGGALLIDEQYATKYFSPLTDGKRNGEVDILGIGLFKKNTGHGSIATGGMSQFTISSEKYKGGLMPMVLQNKFSKDLQYTENLRWGSGYPIPAYVTESWKNNERKLPGLSQTYPWLTVNDFLEPYLVKLSFPANKDKYFFGFEEGISENSGYLPPLKKDFFEFFKVSDLVAGKVIYKVRNNGDGEILVTLGIPINNNRDYIIFEKEYSPMPKGVTDFGLSEPNLDLNEGFIIDVPFNTIIYPPIRSGSARLMPDYSIQLTSERSNLIEEIGFKFINENSEGYVQTMQFANGLDFKYRSDPNGIFNVTTKYYRVLEEFDLISLEMRSSRTMINAAIIPKFIEYNGGTNAYVVAIDFGTTNSHIEIALKENEDKLGTPEPLKISSSQLLSMAVLSKNVNPIDLYLSYLYEFLPEKIGSEFTFPIRTVISENSGVDHLAQDLGLFSDFNIPFYYEKETKRRPDKLHTNLKWARIGEGSYNHTMYFLEELMLLVRNKILMEGGDLSSTKIIWTFPSSMSRGQQAQLGNIWKRVISKYIGESNADAARGLLIAVKESVAPFYHYKKVNSQLMSSRRPVLSIDIGGGTTDTVIYFRDKPEALTSFRFAGNSVFGDGFTEEAAENNGFIQRYKNLFRGLLEKNKIGDLRSYNEDVIRTGISENIISFWFSIEKHPEVKDKSLFSFNTRLANDDEMRLLFVLFYTAIVYHITKMMKEKNYPMPSGLIFSGTGSKIMQIITTDTKLLTDLTKVIIEKIYEEKYDRDTRLSVFCDKETPKEATCKGVLRMKEQDFLNDPENVIYTGIQGRSFDEITYEQAKGQELSSLIVSEVKAFYNFFFELHRSFDFFDNLSVSPKAIKIAKEQLNYSLDDYLATAVDQKSAGLTELDKKLEDTLFFYPIIGSINNLAYELSQQTTL